MAKKKDLLAFLFGESVEAEAAEAELNIAENLERLFEVAAEAEVGDLKSKKTPLAKALGDLGIKDAESDLQLDTEGFVLATDNHDRYVDALTVLGSADAMHRLAEMGWVVTKPGDPAMTNEPPDYRIRFLDITTVDNNDRDPKAGTYDTANREEVIKKAQKFATTPMDRDDDLNPVENDDGKMGGQKTGVGKEKDGAAPEGKPKGSEKKVKESRGVNMWTVYSYLSEEMFGREWSALTGEEVAQVVAKADTLSQEQKLQIEAKGHGLQEFTSTGSMGTAMSQGQPFVGLVKKPKPYGKGTKFKMPSQWRVKQPVVDKQVKRHATTEAEEFERGEVPGTIIIPNDVGKYLALKNKGYTTVWTGNGRICMREPKANPQAKPTTHAESKNVTCGACHEAFDYSKVPEVSMGAVLCPQCGVTLNQEGIVLSTNSAEQAAEQFLNEEAPGEGGPGPERPFDAEEADPAAEEEGDQQYQDMRSDLESGECVVFDDSSPSAPTRVVFSGDELGIISDVEFDRRHRPFAAAPQGVFRDVSHALRAVNAEMERRKFWPNIYHVNDHGNVSLWDKNGREIRAWV